MRKIWSEGVLSVVHWNIKQWRFPQEKNTSIVASAHTNTDITVYRNNAISNHQTLTFRSSPQLTPISKKALQKRKRNKGPLSRMLYLIVLIVATIHINICKE